MTEQNCKILYEFVKYIFNAGYIYERAGKMLKYVVEYLEFTDNISHKTYKQFKMANAEIASKNQELTDGILELLAFRKCKGSRRSHDSSKAERPIISELRRTLDNGEIRVRFPILALKIKIDEWIFVP